MAAVIDGSLSEWSGKPSMSLSASSADYIQPGTPTPSVADLSGRLWFGCSSDSLSIAGVMTDTTILEPPGDDLSIGDAIEVLLDGLNDGINRPGQDDHDLMMAPDGRVADYGISSAADVVTRSTPGSNWRFEMSIPFTDIWTGVGAGSTIGARFGLLDRDTTTPTPGAPVGPDQIMLGPWRLWNIE